MWKITTEFAEWAKTTQAGTKCLHIYNIITINVCLYTFLYI